MEFIFQLFAEMFNFGEEQVEQTQKVEQQEPVDVASYESEVAESPLAGANIFEMVNFH